MPPAVLRIPAAELRRIEAHAARAFPEEACGFLLGSAEPREVREARPADNEKEEERARRYLIRPERLLAAEEEAMRRGLDVLGFYHSHPSGVAEPSAFDREHAWPWWAYLVTGVTALGVGRTTCWRLAEDRSRFEAEALDVR